MHQLNRFPSSPALSSHGTNNGNGNGGPNNYYNALTPKTSYDSLGSLRSFGSSASGTSAGTGTGPWSSSYNGGYGATPATPTTSASSAGGGDFSRNLGFFDNYGYGRPSTNTAFSEQQQQQASFIEQRRGSETESSLLQQQQQQQPQGHPQMNPMISPQRRTFHAASNSASGSAPSTIHQVDPAVEQAFRDMAKSLEEKEATIGELKIQIEALLAAAATSGVSKNDKTVLENGLNRKMDGNEMAHRIVVRLKTLKQENETLGKMLSQGRAAQKEVELGILKRENSLLKSRIEELEKLLNNNNNSSSNINTSNNQ